MGLARNAADSRRPYTAFKCALRTGAKLVERRGRTFATFCAGFSDFFT